MVALVRTRLTAFARAASSSEAEASAAEDAALFLADALASFDEAPFTVQRLCELLLAPTAYYAKPDKLTRAVEKLPERDGDGAEPGRHPPTAPSHPRIRRRRRPRVAPPGSRRTSSRRRSCPRLSASPPVKKRRAKMTSKTICSEGLARTRRLVWEIERRRPRRRRRPDGTRQGRRVGGGCRRRRGVRDGETVMETEAERGTGKTVKRGRGWGRGDISLMPSVTRARAELRHARHARCRVFPSWKKTYFFVLEAAWISVRVRKGARHSKTARCRSGRGRAPWNTPFRCTTSITTTRRWRPRRFHRTGGATASSTACPTGKWRFGARVPPGMRPVSLRGADAVLTVSFDAPRAPHLVV